MATVRSETRDARAFRLVPDPQLAHPFAPLILPQGTSTVGRVAGCQLQLQGDLISRRHAKIVVNDEGVMLHDLDSHNGVFVNGLKVRSSPLRVGDKVYFGNVCAHVEAAEFDSRTPVLSESTLMQQSELGVTSRDPSVRSFQTLCQATDLLLTESDEVFFNEVIRGVLELCDAAVSAIFRPQPHTMQPTHIAFSPSSTRREVPVLTSVLEKSARDRMVLYTKGDANDPILEGHDLGAALAVPLLSGGRAIGVLFVGRNERAGFSDRVVETVSAIAHLVSIRLTGFVAGNDLGDETAIRVGSDTAEGDANESERLREELRATQLELERITTSERERLANSESATAASQGLQETLKQLREQLADAEADQKEMSAALEAARSEVARERQTASSAQSAQQQLEASSHALRAESSSFRERAALAEQEISRLQQKVAEVEAKHAETEDALNAISPSYERLQQKLAGIQSDLAAAAVERLNLQDARLAAEGEVEQVQQELTRAEAELEGMRKSLGDLQSEREKLKAAAVDAAHASARKVLSVVRDTLPARAVHRIEAAAEGRPVGRDLRMAPATVVTVAVKDIDQWAQNASPDLLTSNLDALCQSVRVLAAANGGELAQVYGATHMLTFGGDTDGIRNAVTCAREISMNLGDDIAGGLQLGVHTGAALSGFFGEETSASFVHLGEAVLVSRGAAEFAPRGAIWATETVRAALVEKGDFIFIATGPHLVRGYANPFNLFQVGTGG